MDAKSNILITGGASGIGHATAQLVSRYNANLVVCDRLEASASTFLPRSESGISYVQADVRDVDAVERCLSHMPQGVDGLVLCAGVGPPVCKNPVEIVETNYTAVIHNILACSPRLTEWSSVVLISSTAAYRYKWQQDWFDLLEEPFGGTRAREMWAKVEEMPSREAYALSKWGIVVATKRFARQFGERRVRVNCVAPGPTKTAMSHPLWQLDKPEWTRVVNDSPFKAANTSEEVAGIIGFLISPVARMIHGTIIHIDGGWYSCHVEE